LVKHSLVKQKIIETASDLFYKNGYNTTGINEIIAKSEIAKATLYNHFNSKDDICLAYLKHKNNTFQKDIESFCTSKPKGKSQLLAIFQYLQKFYKTNDFNGCWCIKTVAEIPNDNIKIKSEIQTQKVGLIKFIADLISSNLNKVPKKNIDSLSRKIYLLYESAVAESHLHNDDWPIKEAKEICNHIIN